MRPSYSVREAQIVAMELSSLGEQVFAVESITKKRVRKVRPPYFITPTDTGCLFSALSLSPSLIKNRTKPTELHIAVPNGIPSLRIDILSCLHVSVYGSHYLPNTWSNLNLLLFTN